jgi:hypothetical protein
MSAKAAPLSANHQRIVADVVSSPMRHMCTCVSWNDDSGQLWAGPAARAAMRPEMAQTALTPEPNMLQQRIERAIAYAKRKKIPARIIVLKGRRSGSSLGCAAAINLELKRRKSKSLIMADEADRSTTIFGILSAFATSDVVPWGFGVKTTATKMTYGNGSEVLKDTANDVNAGRGDGIRIMWFSEAAHFAKDGAFDASILMMGALATIPKKPDTIVFVESTANGQSGWYYDTWQTAAWPDDEDYFEKWERRGATNPDNLWIRVFAAWFEIPRNSYDVSKEEGEAIMSRLSKSEKFGVETYGWTPQQLKWRRVTIVNDCKGDESKFDQEYPHSPDSAFISTGSHAFDRDCLNILRQRAKAAETQWKYGVIEPSGATAKQIIAGEGGDYSVSFRRTPMEEAWCAILEEPRDRYRYIFPVDPASEASTTDGSGDLDRMSCLMLRASVREESRDGERIIERPPRIVARILPEVMDEHPDADQTTLMCALLSKWYGNPCIPVEINKGEWVIAKFRTAGLSLYRTQPNIREREQKLRARFGWHTGEESRHTIIKGLQAAIHGHEFETEDGKSMVRQPAIDIEDLFTVAELENFVRNRKGKFEAATGKHDDDVLCLAMGLHLIDFATEYRLPVKRRRR